METSELMTTEEASKYLLISTSTLNKMRIRNEGPKYIKTGAKVFYKKSLLDEYLDDNLIITKGGGSNGNTEP